ASDLSTVDLLALILARKADPHLLLRLTHLLQEYPVRRLRQASSAELQQAGLTPLQAERLVAICELTRRLAVLETPLSPSIRRPGDAVAILRPFMSHLEQETLRVLVLTSTHQVIANLELYRGTIHQIEIRVAEILRPALVRNAPALLVAHCHPSGDPTPSPSDRAMTEQLLEAARLLDLEIIDHLILGNPRYVSLRSLMKWEATSPDHQ
ncbi:MAG TPA: DNA repair protein RadC, partial [Ktedonobacteraceae bacterium]|nr:DNA repair protein RadC [Ktedonobacteraceae bacterium]